jgi:hypothetical protein
LEAPPGAEDAEQQQQQQQQQGPQEESSQHTLDACAIFLYAPPDGG